MTASGRYGRISAVRATHCLGHSLGLPESAGAFSFVIILCFRDVGKSLVTSQKVRIAKWKWRMGAGEARGHGDKETGGQGSREAGGFLRRQRRDAATRAAGPQAAAFSYSVSSPFAPFFDDRGGRGGQGEARRLPRFLCSTPSTSEVWGHFWRTLPTTARSWASSMMMAWSGSRTPLRMAGRSRA